MNEIKSNVPDLRGIPLRDVPEHAARRVISDSATVPVAAFSSAI